MGAVLKSIDTFIDKFARHGLVVCVFGMLFFSLLNIVLRWFGSNFLWVDPLVRHLVFLSAFLGGVMATGANKHIGIDILGKYFETKNLGNAQKRTNQFIYLVSFLTLCWLIKASIQFTNLELQYGKPTFWGIHSGFLTGIIPFGFGIMAFRSLYKLYAETFTEESAEVSE